MNELLNKLSSRRYLLAIISFFCLTYILSLFNRYIHTDGNWFGEEAYWFYKEGVVKLKTMPLTLNFHERVYVYYKLFVFMGAGLIYIFGWSIWPLKFLILIFYLIFIYVYYKTICGNNFGLSKNESLLAIFLLISTPIMIEQSFIFRPEIPMLLLGFLSFIFLVKAIKESNNKYALLAGITVGTSFLMHLNGNVFAISGFIYLLSYKKFKQLIIYSLSTGIISILYLCDIADLDSINAFIYQLKNWPLNIYHDIDSQKFGFFIKRVKGLLNEHQRFFWSSRVYSISILFFFSLIISFKSLKQRFSFLLRYLLILIVCLNILGGYLAEKYLIYYLPFMVVAIVHAIHTTIKKKTTWVAISFLVLFAAHIAMNVLRFQIVFNSNYPHLKHHNEVLSKIPKNSKVLSPWEFIYNGIETHKIYSYKAFEYYTHRILEEKEIKEVIEKLSVEYIIVSNKFDDFINVDLEQVKKNGIFNFKPSYSSERYTVLKKIDEQELIK